MLRVPPQDSLQVGDVLPDESLDFLHVYQACEPQRAIRARLERQVLCRVAELDHGPGIQRWSNAHCVLLPTNVPGYPTLWTDSLTYLRATHTLERSWQADQEAKGMLVRPGKKQTQNPTITNTPRPESRGNDLRVASVSMNPRGRR